MKYFLIIISLFIANNVLANLPILSLEKPEKNVLRDSTTAEKVLNDPSNLQFHSFSNVFNMLIQI